MIMTFDSYEIIRKQGRVKLYTEMLVQYEHASDENLQTGTPQWWDNYLLCNIDIERYDIYFICTNTVPHGRYNCITDYKKVWGLNDLEEGIYDNTYINDYGKVYWGIAKTQGEDAFRSSIGSTILLVERDREISCVDIFKIFQKNRCDFRKPFDLEDLSLSQIYEMNPDTILLRYNCNSEISLNIYGTDVEDIFSTLNISEYNNQNEMTIYRKP